MPHQPIPESVAHGSSELDAKWWSAHNGKEAGHGHAAHPASRLADRAQPGGDQAAEEIWGTPRVPRTTTTTTRSGEGQTSEEIWGAARRTSVSDAAALESIWDDRPSVAPLPASPPAVHRRLFLLPDAWAASPRRPRWRRRLDAFGRVSRRTD